MTKKWSEIREERSKLSPERKREVDKGVRRELEVIPTPWEGACRYSYRDDALPRELRCAKGVDVRAHVGGEDLGWGLRVPCQESALRRPEHPVVPCDELDKWTDQEVAEWRAEFDAAIEKMLSGECPLCGGQLMNRTGGAYCPKGCDVSVHSCNEKDMVE